MQGDAETLTQELLLDEGLEWLLEGSFMGQLDSDERDGVLQEMSWRDVAPGQILIEHGSPAPGVFLIVSGRAIVMLPTGGEEFDTVARVGAGHLLGERSVLLGSVTHGRVQALSPMRTLHVPADAFCMLLDNSEHLRQYVVDLVALRERFSEILHLLLTNPMLRCLGRDDLEVFVQSGQLLRAPAGTRLVSARERSTAVFVVIRGKLAIFSPRDEGGQRALLGTSGPGSLLGEASVLLNLPRTADLEAAEDSEILKVSDKAFVEIISRNPPLQRQIYQHVATLDLRAEEALREYVPLIITVYGDHSRRGVTTLSYALAANAEEGRRIVVDLDGPKSAQRLGFSTGKARFGNVHVHSMDLPEGWDFEAVWPKRPEDLEPLLAALERRLDPWDTVVVGATSDRDLQATARKHSEAVVLIRHARDAATTAQGRRGPMHIEAVRLEKGVELPFATSRNAVRMAPDGGTANRFWHKSDIDLLTGKDNPLARAADRVYRVIRGHTVGIGLGGGGALGFAHLALLRVLHENGVPIDYVAGSSFGALVGCVYAAGGLELLDELMRQRKRLTRNVMMGMFTLKPLSRFLHELTGGQGLSETEVPFYPVTMDIWSGRKVVLYRGTLAEGAEASASFPGFFPAYRKGIYRLVDGGIIDVVPASVVWDAGAHFTIAANIIPRLPSGADPVMGDSLLERIQSATISRLDDALRGAFFMMSQTGRDRSTLADYVFDFDVEGFNLPDFHRGDEIYEHGLVQAKREVGDILHARARSLKRAERG